MNQLLVLFSAQVSQTQRTARLVLRVTLIFRRENDDWKIIHRHGDAVVEQAEMPPVRQG